MAQRRMLNIDLILDDSFTQELSPEAQIMYVYLNMLADDDGIVGHLKRQLRMLGKSTDQIAELVKAGYLLKFNDETLIITDWLVNNHIRGDRYTASREDDCRSSLYITYNWRFSLKSDNPKVFINYTQWLKNKRTVNDKTIDKISREELKEAAVFFHKSNPNLPLNISGNQVGTNRVPDGNQAVPPVSVPVPVSGAGSGSVPGTGKGSGSGKGLGLNIRLHPSSNGGMGGNLLTTGSGKSALPDIEPVVNNSDSPEHGLIDYLNTVQGTNIPNDDKRLNILLTDLLNQFKLEYVEQGLQRLLNTIKGAKFPDESVKKMVTAHLAENVKAVTTDQSSNSKDRTDTTIKSNSDNSDTLKRKDDH